MKIIVPNETACCNYSKDQKWLSFCGACLLSRNSGLVYCEVTEKPVQDAIFEGDFLPLRRFFVLEFSSVFFSCIVFSIVLTFELFRHLSGQKKPRSCLTMWGCSSFSARLLPDKIIAYGYAFFGIDAFFWSPFGRGFLGVQNLGFRKGHPFQTEAVLKFRVKCPILSR